jgi:biofilm PGA synthesis lipoprotein PgaB
MAMPYMEKVDDPQGWLKRLAWAALANEKNKNRIIFELQTKNLETSKAIPSDVLRKQIILLFQMGGTSLAYYPDDFYKNLPPAEMINPCLSSLEACNQ